MKYLIIALFLFLSACQAGTVIPNAPEQGELGDRDSGGESDGAPDSGDP
jgi:hypothetical protein